MKPITVDLSPELLLRLETLAQLKEVSIERLVCDLLDQHLPPADVKALEERRQKAWEEYLRLSEEEDEEDAKDPDAIYRSIDEDRLGTRKLFPPEMKGISW